MFKEAEALSGNGYQVIIKRSKFGNEGKNDFDCCRATMFVIQINAKGNVAPCGHLLGYKADEFNLGNITTTRFTDIVRSPHYFEIQKKVRELDVNKDCETNCLHYYMNHFLQRLDNPPEHINFV
jgi:radical SAM protein with 4Fe4S-binding SPASM domain